MKTPAEFDRRKVFIAAALLAFACGGSPTAPSGSPSPSAAPPSVVATGRLIWDSSWAIRSGDPTFAAVGREVVSNVPRGPVTVTLEWTPASADLRLQVTNFDCPGGLINGVFFNDQCPIYGQANQRASGAQRVDFDNAATRGIAIWISNYSPTGVDYHLRVFVPGVSSAPTPTPAPTRTGPIGQVALLGASVPFGGTVPTVRLGTTGQAAPSLTFSIAVRTFENESGILARVWVRNDSVRCMGAGIARLDFSAGEQRVLNFPNVSFQNGNEPAPCALPYTTRSVEITLTNAAGQEVLSQTFPGSYTFLPPA